MRGKDIGHVVEAGQMGWKEVLVLWKEKERHEKRMVFDKPHSFFLSLILFTHYNQSTPIPFSELFLLFFFSFSFSFSFSLSFLPPQPHPHFHNAIIPSSSHSFRLNHMINILPPHNPSHSRSITITHPAVFLLSFLFFSISCVFATTDFPTLALRDTLSSLCEVNKEGEFGSCCRTYDLSSVSLEESPARDCFISSLISTSDGIEYLFVHFTHPTSILQHPICFHQII